ncbi:MAG TPA: phasin family protein [Alphaproteobacteria bacterium]|nr:phasin family protein [Alphaproteobacteria bacterium]
MTKQANARAQRREDGFGSLGMFTQQNLEHAIRINEEVVEGLFATWQELLNLGKSRVHENLEAWKALGACQSPGAAVECQRRFAEKATEQYLGTAERLTQLLGRVAMAPCSPHYISRAAGAANGPKTA